MVVVVPLLPVCPTSRSKAPRSFPFSIALEFELKVTIMVALGVALERESRLQHHYISKPAFQLS